MVLLRVLGGIDLIGSLTFLTLIFGIGVPFQILLFAAGLLFIKSLFILRGEPLSAIDLLSAVFLILSIFFTLYTILLWIPAFLLLAKGILSFI